MREDRELRPCCNAGRRQTMKLMAMVTEGERLAPKAFALYLVTKGPLDAQADAAAVQTFVERWWDLADEVCRRHDVRLMPVEIRDGRSMDLVEYDRLVELHTPL